MPNAEKAAVYGDLVLYRIVCPACEWRHVWEQEYGLPGLHDGLCERCGHRCNGDDPAMVLIRRG